MTDRNERISDDEREQALKALGQHFGNGRLDLSEFEERSDKAIASVTFQDLDDLFTDLPLPHYNTGLAVRESNDPVLATPADTPEARRKRVRKRLAGLEETAWTLAGLWIPISFIFFGGLGWQIALAPIFLMIVLSVVLSAFAGDADDDDD